MHKEAQISNNIFTAHPASIGESYWEHFRFAMFFAGMLIYAGFAAFVHALLPFCFEKTAGLIINDLARIMAERKSHGEHV